MSVVKSNNKQVDFMFLDEVRVKKFGFGSNLVTFLDVPPTEETIAIEAHTPTDTGLAFQNLFNPAFNLFTDRLDISPVRDRPKTISSSQQDNLQRVVLGDLNSNPEQSQITVIKSSKQYVPEGFVVQFSVPVRSDAELFSSNYQPYGLQVEFPPDDADWTMEGILYTAMTQAKTPHGWLNYQRSFPFSASLRDIRNAPEEEGGVRGVTTSFNDKYKYLHGVLRDGGVRESFSISVYEPIENSNFEFNVSWGGNVLLNLAQAKLDYIFKAGSSSAQAHLPHVDISLSPPEETTIVRYGLDYNFESYTLEYKLVKKGTRFAGETSYRDFPDTNWTYWFSTEKIIGDRCYRDGWGNCDENQSEAWNRGRGKVKFAEIVRSSPNHPDPNVPWLSDPEILTHNGMRRIATAQGSSYIAADGRVVRMGQKNVPSWNGLHDPKRDDAYQYGKDFTNTIDGLTIFSNSPLFEFRHSCNYPPFFRTQIPLGHTGGESPEWRSDGSNPTNDSAASPFTTNPPFLYRFRVKANYVARQADGDLIDVWSSDYKEDLTNSDGMTELDTTQYAPEDREGLKWACGHFSYNSANLG